MAEEKNSEKVIRVADGADHGYFGTVQDDTPNDDYTVTGVTKDDDKPKPAPKPAAKRSTSAKS